MDEELIGGYVSFRDYLFGRVPSKRDFEPSKNAYGIGLLPECKRGGHLHKAYLEALPNAA